MPAVLSDASVLICLGATQQLNLLTALKPIVDALVPQHSFRWSRNLHEQFLRKAGEPR